MKNKIIKCEFTSEWSDGSIVTTNCEYDSKTGYVNPEVSKGIVPIGLLLKEYITLENGDVLNVCQDCHEYVIKSVVGDLNDLSYGEYDQCSNNCELEND